MQNLIKQEWAKLSGAECARLLLTSGLERFTKETKLPTFYSCNYSGLGKIHNQMKLIGAQHKYIKPAELGLCDSIHLGKPFLSRKNREIVCYYFEEPSEEEILRGLKRYKVRPIKYIKLESL